MSVYVDPLFVSTHTPSDPQAARYFGKGKQSCHLYADTREELIAFAPRIGLRLEWLQHDTTPVLRHFDLTPIRRRYAVQLGAVEHTRQEHRAWLREKIKETTP